MTDSFNSGKLHIPVPPSALVEELILLANTAGGPDNIAAVVLEVTGEESGRVQPGPHVSPAVIAARRPDLSSEPEILILGIEELDLDNLTGDAGNPIPQRPKPPRPGR